MASKKQKPITKQKRSKKWWEYALLAFIIIIVFTYIFAIPHNTTPSTTQTVAQWRELGEDETTCTNAKFCVKVDNAQYNNYGYSEIAGRIINNTGTNLSYVQISIGIYKGETKTDSCLDNINYLDKGATWSFKVLCRSSDGSSYRIEDITGW